MKIQSSIAESVKSFVDKKWWKKDFLTEDDVRCKLYWSLERIFQNESNVSIHSEVRWYGKSGWLKYRSDIVVLVKDNINTEDPTRLPSKWYSFNDYHAVIEIKLRRVNCKSSDDTYTTKSIDTDINKLKKIRNDTTVIKGLKIQYFVIVFDIKNRRKLLIDDIDSSTKNWETWDIEN